MANIITNEDLAGSTEAEAFFLHLLSQLTKRQRDQGQLNDSEVMHKAELLAGLGFDWGITDRDLIRSLTFLRLLEGDDFIAEVRRLQQFRVIEAGGILTLVQISFGGAWLAQNRPKFVDVLYEEGPYLFRLAAKAEPVHQRRWVLQRSAAHFRYWARVLQRLFTECQETAVDRFLHDLAQTHRMILPARLSN